MDNFIISFKKIPYPEKRKLFFIFISIAFLTYAVAMIYTKIQTKLYQTESNIEFEWSNKILNAIIEKNNDIQINDIVKDIIFSDTQIDNVLNDLKLINVNESIDTVNIIRKKMRERIDFAMSKDSNFSYVIRLTSSEPKKATQIINSLTNQAQQILINKIIEKIESEKKYIDEIIPEIKNELGRNIEYTLILNEFYKRNNYLTLLFKNNHPTIKIKSAIIPSKPYYPNERQSAIAGWVLGIFIGLIIIILLTIRLFFKTNNLTLFECRKEYKERKKSPVG